MPGSVPPRDSAAIGAGPDPPALIDGRYRVERELGRGGMGVVVAARDLRLGRVVAVKLLPPGPHTEIELRRFEQEARAAGALDHANIVAVHDIGTAGGAPYIVSELLHGRTLRDRLAAAPLSVRAALEYAAQ